MEYTQLTLNDWLDMKTKLKQQLMNLKKGYVSVGYYLRKMEDSKGYEAEGYKSLAEFAKCECGLEASTVSKFMSINKAYSIDGYSELLLPEYEDFNRSQLEEMLRLPDKDREMITPETKREDIRQLKQFNKETPVEGVADTEHELIKAFFEENRVTLTDLYESDAWQQSDMEGMRDIVNPSGSRSYRKGLFFMAMSDMGVRIKKFGTNPEPMKWDRFFEITKEIFGDSLPEDQTAAVEEIAPAKIEEAPVNTETETVSEVVEIERNDRPEMEEHRGCEGESEDSSENEEGEREEQESSCVGDGESADQGREKEAGPSPEREGQGNKDPEEPGSSTGGEADTSEETSRESQKQDSEVINANVLKNPENAGIEAAINPPEEPERVTGEVIMKKTEMCFNADRMKEYIKANQWEMAEKMLKSIETGIRQRKEMGYVPE